MRITIFIFLFVSFSLSQTYAEDGYELWLRYSLLKNEKTLNDYNKYFSSIFAETDSRTTEIIADELNTAIKGITGKALEKTHILKSGAILAVTSGNALLKDLKLEDRIARLGDEGFLIISTTLQGKKCILITGKKPVAVLYGTFHFLRMLQQGVSLDKLNYESKPSIQRRILNHWDNLDRTVERGYAGFSIWDWHRLPHYIDKRYVDYARANASLGINGTVLTNVNANALVLTEDYLKKVAALADLFRPYGIRVYLTARFSAPIEIGKLPTADPLDARVQQWWNEKTAEIYKKIPDFGGFLVKANSEGQPGPQNYGRTHADGANMLADAVAPFGGIVMWRAFVYDNNVPTDRVKQAYSEFKPLDGKFRENVIIQVKNGPLDFQPREPFHPLFGAMTNTPLMIEFQLTQEYLGFATHLVYLATLFQEVLESDTFQKGEGSTVRKVIDGTLYNNKYTAIAGVANIGNDRNWCGHPFAQANWYAYGRLAWNPALDAKQIGDEWIMQTFSSEKEIASVISNMMMKSREITVNYMTPLGLHHIMGWSHHYGPGPWIKDKQRADWTSVYYHKADSAAIGFNRTETGSNALEQYHPLIRKKYEDPATCPEEYLLWFHHVPWTRKLKSGRNLWEEMCYKYYSGTDDVKRLQDQWNSLKGKVDQERFEQVKMLLTIQYEEACLWRNSCLLYFQTFSKMKIPESYQQPDKSLEYYQSLQFPFAPGINPRW
jgi:alpha-glucuronidase